MSLTGLVLGAMVMAAAAACAQAEPERRADPEREAVRITGRALGPSGAGLAAGRVLLTRLAEGPFASDGGLKAAARASLREADGRFEILAPEPGFWRLRVEAPGHVPATRTLAPLWGPVHLPAVTLPADSGLLALTVDAEGRPVSGAILRAASGGGGSFWPAANLPRWTPAARAARSDRSGLVRLATAEGERLLASAWAPGRELVDVGELEAVASAASPAVRITLPEAAATLWRLRPRGGPPPQAAAVRFGPGDWSFLAKDGEFAAPPGAAALRARADLAPGRRQILRFEGDTAAIAPQEAARGEVRSSLDGRPVEGAWIWLEGQADLAARSDEDGRFALYAAPGEPARGLRFEVAAPGFRTRSAVFFPADGAAEQIFELDPAAALAGRVLDPQGRPQVEVQIDATDRRRGALPPSLSDSRGRFFVDGLGPDERITLTLG
ncbi:MAG: carboxypeptidase-like regulatory domain-containing protein, partial [Acidobacteriota bacterium]